MGSFFLYSVLVCVFLFLFFKYSVLFCWFFFQDSVLFMAFYNTQICFAGSFFFFQYSCSSVLLVFS